MKRFVWFVTLLSILSVAVAESVLQLQITVPATNWTDAAFSNACESGWQQLTGSTNYTDLWVGWSTNYCLVADTNVVIYLYRNSAYNITGSYEVDAAIISNTISAITNYTNSHAGINTTPFADLITWGIETQQGADL